MKLFDKFASRWYRYCKVMLITRGNTHVTWITKKSPEFDSIEWSRFSSRQIFAVKKTGMIFWLFYGSYRSAVV